MGEGIERRGRLVLGLDPGTAVTGWGLVSREGSRLSCVEYGCWKTSAGTPLPRRLLQITEGLEALLARTRPDAVAIEQAFFGKNVQSALRLGEARGSLLLTCARLGIETHEYPTASVKKALVGNGRADKTQVQFMLTRLLRMSAPPEPLDASDALALAFTLAMEGGPSARSASARLGRL
ncbi:MAG: crossover junction endodeoxyribonuclease RuvC [Planctomycetota bacterium]